MEHTEWSRVVLVIASLVLLLARAAGTAADPPAATAPQLSARARSLAAPPVSSAQSSAGELMHFFIHDLVQFVYAQ